ncbi:MAG TPA: hypothetical protein PKW08_08530 [Flavobacteriaceae bacterium]|nr:hypothetical protein [Flavobacteriaceae bacterium]HPF12440.1 hypothetical protein [Flavobacteriaceae bacterium]HQU21623.1 hypothetical protein [Flavobacteriaceae bacterium]HQU66198.1 hypothetical protein [Flavobacteriaceae bacterium]
MKSPIFIAKHLLKKVLISRLCKRYVLGNQVLIDDIERTYLVRGCTSKNSSVPDKFKHLMIYYPSYAFLFFWRIKKGDYRWRRYFTKGYECKIFGSTKIAGGLVCFHPFGTVINAKSIGKNFEFRNGLTIGNKNNDNTLLPVIGDHVTVGANTVIIGDITIGDHVTIGAGSVVVHSFPSRCVIAGNPAKIIKTIS